MKIIAKNKDLGQRIDKFLAEKIADKTRSKIKKMIQQGLVLLNDKPVKVHYFLKTGDQITFKQNQVKKIKGPVMTDLPD